MLLDSRISDIAARMRINDTAAARLQELGVELRQGVSLAEKTSLGIGGTTDEIAAAEVRVDSGSHARACG